jgi:hypothetical protein
MPISPDSTNEWFFFAAVANFCAMDCAHSVNYYGSGCELQGSPLLIMKLIKKLAAKQTQ